MENKKLSKIIAVAQNTLNECIRHKILNILIVFALALLGGSFLIKELAPGAEKRTLIDTGYATIELFGFLAVILSVFITTFEEFEMRNIWITLTKPVSKTTYLTGKFLGIALTLFLNIAIMFILLLFLALLNGVELNINYLYVVLGIYLSLLLCASFTLLFSLVSTNLATGIIFSSFIFFTGHLSENLKSLIDNTATAPAVKVIAAVFYYLLPNLSLFNLKDKVYMFPDSVFPFAYVGKIILYAAVYSTVCLYIAGVYFKKKEL